MTGELACHFFLRVSIDPMLGKSLQNMGRR
jgi:hypothetical protein